MVAPRPPGVSCASSCVSRARTGRHCRCRRRPSSEWRGGHAWVSPWLWSAWAFSVESAVAFKPTPRPSAAASRKTQVDCARTKRRRRNPTRRHDQDQRPRAAQHHSDEMAQPPVAKYSVILPTYQASLSRSRSRSPAPQLTPAHQERQNLPIIVWLLARTFSQK